MLPDPEFRDAVDRLAGKVAELDADVRVTKHAVANMQMQSNSLATKLDKIEERMGQKLDGLSDKVAALNVKQERGLGFFAGIAFVIVSCGGTLLALAKFLFGGNV